MLAPLFKNLQILNSRGRQQRGNYCTWLSVVFSSNCGWPARAEAHQWPHEVIQEPREAGRQRVRGRGAEVRADAAADHGRGEQLASLTPALSHGQANIMSQVRETLLQGLWQHAVWSRMEGCYLCREILSFLILFDLKTDHGGCEKFVGAFIPSAFRHSQCSVHQICTSSAESFWN